MGYKEMKRHPSASTLWSNLARIPQNPPNAPGGIFGSGWSPESDKTGSGLFLLAHSTSATCHVLGSVTPCTPDASCLRRQDRSSWGIFYGPNGRAQCLAPLFRQEGGQQSSGCSSQPSHTQETATFSSYKRTCPGASGNPPTRISLLKTLISL